MTKRGDMIESDPRAAQALRAGLAVRRARGQDFSVAWPLALTEALRGADAGQRVHWRHALEGTRWAWRAAYEGRAAPACGALDRLELVAA